jgi:hypothetical protein
MITESTPRFAGQSNWSAPVFVLGVWACMFLWALVFTWQNCSTIALADEFGWLPLLVGDQPVTLGWLWEQYYEHRVPLAKLIWLGFLGLTGNDLPLASLATVSSVAAMALAMIWAARILRGRLFFSDAIFPLVLLNPSQATNFLIWWQVNHIPPPLLGSTLFLIMVLSGKSYTVRDAVLTGCCLVLLPLSGPQGLPYALAGAIWLGTWCCLALLSGQPHARRTSLFFLPVAAASILLVAVYFLNFTSPEDYPYDFSFQAVSRRSLQLFAIGLGMATQSAWEYWGSGVLLLWLLTMAALGFSWLTRTQERFRAFGLLLLLGAQGSLIVVLGRARAGVPDDYIGMGIYVTLASPLICSIYLVWELYGGRTLGLLVQVCLFTASCILLLKNMDAALIGAHDLRRQLDLLGRDIAAGHPVSALAEDHTFWLYAWKDHEQEADYKHWVRQSMRAQKRAGIGPFRSMADDPPHRWITIPAQPAAVHELTWSNGAARGLNENSYLVFGLPEPRFVYAVQVHIKHGEPAPRPNYVLLSWTPVGTDGTTETQSRFATLFYGSAPKPTEGTEMREKAITFWVNGTIAHFLVLPDPAPGVFHLSEIRLMVPPEE